MKYKLSTWMIFFKCIILAIIPLKNQQNSWLIFKIRDLLIFVFCINELLFCWKLAKFITNCQSMNFSHNWYICKCMILFWINVLLFLQKSVKFTTNWWNMNSLYDRYFWNAQSFDYIHYLNEDWQNSLFFTTTCWNIMKKWR